MKPSGSTPTLTITFRRHVCFTSEARAQLVVLRPGQSHTLA
jgi:hypothetical protein